LPYIRYQEWATTTSRMHDVNVGAGVFLFLWLIPLHFLCFFFPLLGCYFSPVFNGVTGTVFRVCPAFFQSSPSNHKYVWCNSYKKNAGCSGCSTNRCHIHVMPIFPPQSATLNHKNAALDGHTVGCRSNGIMVVKLEGCEVVKNDDSSDDNTCSIIEIICSGQGETGCLCMDSRRYSVLCYVVQCLHYILIQYLILNMHGM
jgi:hypothetical protein